MRIAVCGYLPCSNSQRWFTKRYILHARVQYQLKRQLVETPRPRRDAHRTSRRALQGRRPLRSALPPHLAGRNLVSILCPQVYAAFEDFQHVFLAVQTQGSSEPRLRPSPAARWAFFQKKSVPMPPRAPRRHAGGGGSSGWPAIMPDTDALQAAGHLRPVPTP